jgi:hypothetical protein
VEEFWAGKKEYSRSTGRANSWRRGILTWADPLSLLNRIDLIHRKIVKMFLPAAGPGEFDAIDRDVGSQAEV